MMKKVTKRTGTKRMFSGGNIEDRFIKSLSSSGDMRGLGRAFGIDKTNQIEVERRRGFNQPLGSGQLSADQNEDFPQGAVTSMPMKRGGPVKSNSPSKNWIKDAIKKPGALRKSLGVKEGKTIPAKTLATAAKKPGKMGQRARLANTLSKLGRP